MALTVEQPTGRSFYVTGGTLASDAKSYVERQADSDLLTGIRRGEFCYVLNTRQMGKSSLMIRTAGQLRAEGSQVAVLDLTAIGQNLTPAQWYAGLLTNLGEQLNREDDLEDYWAQQAELGPLQRFFEAIRRLILPSITTSLVVFVDEIDAVRSLAFPADEFFAAIRACYNKRAIDPIYQKLTFCLLGVATPADLISDTRISPFNVGTRILLTDFTAEEAKPLARGLAGGQPVLERVLYWTGGHPYMTQRLCRAIAEQDTVIAPDAVDRLCANLFLTRQARDLDDNLAFVRSRLLRSEADLASLLELYMNVRSGKSVKDDETDPLVPILRLSGVVTVREGLLYVRNRIYDRVFDRDWVRGHMPDADLRRQRDAFRRGVVRTAALALTIILIMTVLIIDLQLAKERANREATTARMATKLAMSQIGNAVAGQKQAAQSTGAPTTKSPASASASVR